MRHTKRPRDDTQNVARKRYKTEGPAELGVPANLQDMDAPLKDMAMSLFRLDCNSPERSARTHTPVQTGQQAWGRAQDSFLMPPHQAFA